jgi:hypothetical protein
VNRIEMGHDDFNGEICSTGTDCQLATASHLRDFPRKTTLSYYVKSMPGSGAIVAFDFPLVITFQAACDEWTKYTKIKFQRINNQEADFIIRIANKDEEIEKKSLVADSFFWSSSKDVKVIRIWKRISEWDAYSVFLHEIGHVLGFRHEHVFLSQEERAFIGNLFFFVQFVVDVDCY